MRLGDRNLGFREPVANFEVEGTEIFGTGTCDRTAGFYHVLSVFVVLSVSVKSAMECQMTCLMKCFLRCVSERYDVKSRRSPFKKKITAFGGNDNIGQMSSKRLIHPDVAMMSRRGRSKVRTQFRPRTRTQPRTFFMWRTVRKNPVKNLIHSTRE